MASWFATSGGPVIGFSHYTSTRDEDAPPRLGEVTSIYLLGSHWRQGAGSLLLGATVRRLRDAGFARATLWVLEANERTRAFYEARGWTADGASKVDDRGTFQLQALRYERRI